MNKSVSISMVIIFTIYAGVVLAHGEEGPKDHRSTQIGADDSFRPGASEKLSREEVSSLVSPTLEQEDSRASIKFIILVLLLCTVCWLFFPRTISLPKKDEPTSSAAQISQPPSTQP